jgi:DNA-binding IclR family transcriptional regulator
MVQSPAMSSTRPATSVQVIQRASAILQALKGEPQGLSLSQIAERVGLARSTVHRIVSALETEGLLMSASPTGRFRLGPALASLGASAGRDLALDVHPFLVRLSEEANETVDLAVLEHEHVLFIDQVVADHRLRAASAVGAVFPAHCTANGKALLAALSDDQVRRLLPRRLARLTPATITERAALLDELAEIRELGVAYDREEHTVGICAVGAAVGDPDGRFAAVTIPMPAQRFYGNETRLAATLLHARDAIDEFLQDA